MSSPSLVTQIMQHHSLPPGLAAHSHPNTSLFAAEEGVEIKTGRDADVAGLSCSFLIEGAGREKLSPAGLSSKAKT